MKSNFFPPKHRLGFWRAILAFRKSAFRMRGRLELWTQFAHRRTLQRLETLNDGALRDIGQRREPESRLDEWWKTHPPP